MDYFFYFYVSDKYIQFRKKKYINLGSQFHYKMYNERDRNVNETFVFIFHHSSYLSMKLLVILFIREKKHLLGNTFGSPHTSNRIYLLRNFFPKCVYLRDMYITLKDSGKVLFVSVFRILLICKFLNFTVVFTNKKENFPKFAFNFLCGKVNFSLIHRTHITIHSF